MRKTLLALILGVLWLVTASAQAPAGLQGAINRIDAMAAAEQAKDNVGSITVGVVSGAKFDLSGLTFRALTELAVP